MSRDTNDERITLRLPSALRERLDAHAADLEKRLGVRVLPAEAARKLLIDALEAAEVARAAEETAMAKARRTKAWADARSKEALGGLKSWAETRSKGGRRGASK